MLSVSKFMGITWFYDINNYYLYCNSNTGKSLSFRLSFSSLLLELLTNISANGWVLELLQDKSSFPAGLPGFITL